MVDIQSPTAEIRRGKDRQIESKKERKKKRKKERKQKETSGQKYNGLPYSIGRPK